MVAPAKFGICSALVIEIVTHIVGRFFSIPAWFFSTNIQPNPNLSQRKSESTTTIFSNSYKFCNGMVKVRLNTELKKSVLNVYINIA